MVIKPLEEDHTPATVKPFQVSLVEPVACSLSQTDVAPAVSAKTGPAAGNRGRLRILFSGSGAARGATRAAGSSAGGAGDRGVGCWGRAIAGTESGHHGYFRPAPKNVHFPLAY